MIWLIIELIWYFAVTKSCLSMHFKSRTKYFCLFVFCKFMVKKTLKFDIFLKFSFFRDSQLSFNYNFVMFWRKKSKLTEHEVILPEQPYCYWLPSYQMAQNLKAVLNSFYASFKIRHIYVYLWKIINGVKKAMQYLLKKGCRNINN